MKLNIDKYASRRIGRSVTLKPSSIALLEELAEGYDISVSRVVEAMVEQFGPKLLDQVRSDNQMRAEVEGGRA